MLHLLASRGVMPIFYAPACFTGICKNGYIRCWDNYVSTKQVHCMLHWIIQFQSCLFLTLYKIMVLSWEASIYIANKLCYKSYCQLWFFKKFGTKVINVLFFLSCQFQSHIFRVLIKPEYIKFCAGFNRMNDEWMMNFQDEW